MADNNRLIKLYDRFIENTATVEELREFWSLVKDMNDDDPLHEHVYTLYDNLKADADVEVNWERANEKIFGKEIIHQAPVHRVHFLKNAWFKYAAAVIILLGIGAYLWNTQQKEKPSVTQTNPVPLQNDVAPGGNRATLTLADGSKIVLDSAANGKLAQEGKTEIEKRGNEIVYFSKKENLFPSLREGSGVGSKDVVYNTMTTPRGGQYQLTLPDGSQVWLNAESSITYPVAFKGNERKVSITGEAYFEVTKNKSKPFKVTISPAGGGVREANGGGLEIEVLGTHFNVNSYSEEPTKNITLIEGSVRLTNSVHTSLILKPGQQGQLKNQQLSLAANPDVEQVMAWKNGMFRFNRATMQEVMRQLSRWYDVDVVYEKEIPNIKFAGEMQRSLKLSQVLNILEKMEVKFKIEGKKLIVK